MGSFDVAVLCLVRACGPVSARTLTLRRLGSRPHPERWQAELWATRDALARLLMAGLVERTEAAYYDVTEHGRDWLAAYWALGQPGVVLGDARDLR